MNEKTSSKDLEFSTLAIIGAGAGMLILGFALLFTLRWIGMNYVREVGGVASASRASRITTTWPDGPQSHAVQTTRQPGQTVHDWGELHRQERDGLMAEIGPK